MLSYGCLPRRALAGGVLANRYGLASPWIVGDVLNLAATAVTVPLLIRYRKR
jgi:predicted MFS family arabinose efflux permease